jgi:hypothetical protein
MPLFSNPYRFFPTSPNRSAAQLVTGQELDPKLGNSKGRSTKKLLFCLDVTDAGDCRTHFTAGPDYLAQVGLWQLTTSDRSRRGARHRSGGQAARRAVQ